MRIRSPKPLMIMALASVALLASACGGGGEAEDGDDSEQASAQENEEGEGGEGGEKTTELDAFCPALCKCKWLATSDFLWHQTAVIEYPCLRGAVP